jgi:transcriptional antiterminator RfaH
MMPWYAVNTKTHSEAIAGRNLENLGVEVFLPMLSEEKAVRGQLQRVKSPLFPGYLFARFEVASQLRMVTYARGVKRIVSFGDGPCGIDDSLIEGIRDRTTNGVLELVGNGVSPGKVVRIKEGPLCGLEAVFEKQLNGATRAVLLLKALSFQARVILGSQQVVNL